MNFFKNCVHILLFLLIINSLDAQSRFGGGIVLGFNASQMDGDESAGFRKVGANAGLRGTVQLNESGKWLLATDLLFSQRGSRSTPNDYAPIFLATLNYLEATPTISYRDWKMADKNGRDYYKVYFTAGLSYGKLFSYKISENFTHPKDVWDVFQTNDISITGGLSYFLNSHWGFNWRYTHSLNYLFNPEKHLDNVALSTYKPLQVYFLTFQTVWMF